MAHADPDRLVSAAVISRTFGIPLNSVYRMADKGRIPFEDVTQAWHERRRLLFDLEAVRARLEAIEAERRQAS